MDGGSIRFAMPVAGSARGIDRMLDRQRETPAGHEAARHSPDNHGKIGYVMQRQHRNNQVEAFGLRLERLQRRSHVADSGVVSAQSGIGQHPFRDIHADHRSGAASPRLTGKITHAAANIEDPAARQ